VVVNRKMWDVTACYLLGRCQLFEKPAASIFRVDQYKATQENVVRCPSSCFSSVYHALAFPVWPSCLP
jgi:hypothetical protein